MFGDDDEDGSWWKTLGFGVLCLTLSVILFWYFSHLESQGTSGRIWWILAVLYNMGGKWLTCSVVAGAGLLLVILGIKQWRDEG